MEENAVKKKENRRQD
jgi:hypothetical protein